MCRGSSGLEFKGSEHAWTAQAHPRRRRGLQLSFHGCIGSERLHRQSQGAGGEGPPRARPPARRPPRAKGAKGGGGRCPWRRATEACRSRQGCACDLEQLHDFGVAHPQRDLEGHVTMRISLVHVNPNDSFTTSGRPLLDAEKRGVRPSASSAKLTSRSAEPPAAASPPQSSQRWAPRREACAHFAFARFTSIPGAASSSFTASDWPPWDAQKRGVPPALSSHVHVHAWFTSIFHSLPLAW